MTSPKLTEDYAVATTRNDVRDALILAGEQCIAIALYHVSVDTVMPRCQWCTDDVYGQGEGDCTHCFAPGALVRVAEGFRPIEEISVGDQVLTSDGTYQPVIQTMVNHFSGTAYQWRTATMTLPVISTGEHPVRSLITHHLHRTQMFMDGGQPYCTPSYCESAGRSRFPERHHMGWVDAARLTARSWVQNTSPMVEEALDYVEIPAWAYSGHGPRPRGVARFDLNEDFLWIVGMYLAEGSPGTRVITFGLHENEDEYQRRIIQFFSERDYQVTVERGSDHGVKVVVASAVLARWWPVWLGSGCQNKRIPEEIMRLPVKEVMAVVRGVYDGDGTKGVPEIGQTSEVLALQLVEILERDGRQPTIRHLASRSLTPLGRARRLAYVVSWAGDDFTHKHRKRRWMLSDNEKLSRVVHHRPVSYSGPVHNLEVAGSHTYVVQNVLVHNCYGTSMDTPIKDARRVYGVFADKVLSEQFASQGTWALDSREVQIEWSPQLLEHDVIVRVRQWNTDGTPLELEGFYGVQAVTADSLRTGTRFGQSANDLVGQRAVITKLAPNLPITAYPVLGVQFPGPVNLAGLTVTAPERVVYVPSPAEEVQVFTFVQSTPEAVWTIVHPLDHLPEVTLVVGQEEVEAEVTYPSLNTVLVDFGVPVAGTAELE